MAEFTRAIVSRFRQYVGERRRAKRYTVRLSFSISVPDRAKSSNGSRRTRVMEGHTLDISASGLALIVPAITLGEHHLVGENRSLNVRLELPADSLQLKVSPVRYESLDEHETETGYLIGARILEMTDEDRERFMRYVASLADQKS
ncbi:MAG: PilZ domain-containing protein [Pyrinomonadaceae bacterium]